jgi:hypothetical protein
MSDSGIRARIERLLRGNFRSHDLTALFLYSRDRSRGRESVQELGDFIAHNDLRTKGILTRLTRDWHITAWFHFLSVQGAVRDTQLPARFPDFLRASLRETPNNTSPAGGIGG